MQQLVPAAVVRIFGLHADTPRMAVSGVHLHGQALTAQMHCQRADVSNSPFAAFSSSGQLRGPSGLYAAPGTYSKDIELDFIVIPLACSSSLLSR